MKVYETSAKLFWRTNIFIRGSSGEDFGCARTSPAARNRHQPNSTGVRHCQAFGVICTCIGIPKQGFKIRLIYIYIYIYVRSIITTRACWSIRRFQYLLWSLRILFVVCKSIFRKCAYPKEQPLPKKLSKIHLAESPPPPPPRPPKQIPPAAVPKEVCVFVGILFHDF